MIWMEVFNAGVWTDATDRRVVSIGADTSNRITLSKSSSANTINVIMRAGGTSVSVNIATSSTLWLCLGITWNKVANRIRIYFGGVQQGADNAYTGVWAGSLTDAWTRIGSIGGGNFLHGYPSFLMLSSAEATAEQMAAGAIAT